MASVEWIMKIKLPPPVLLEIHNASNHNNHDIRRKISLQPRKQPIRHHLLAGDNSKEHENFPSESSSLIKLLGTKDFCFDTPKSNSSGPSVCSELTPRQLTPAIPLLDLDQMHIPQGCPKLYPRKRKITANASTIASMQYPDAATSPNVEFQILNDNGIVFMTPR